MHLLGAKEEVESSPKEQGESGLPNRASLVKMDRPMGEREDLWSWRKVKEDHAPPRPVYHSGTHPPHLSEPVSGKPYRLVEPPRGAVNEQTRGDANCT